MRTIVHGEGVDEALEAALERWPNAGEVWEAMTWLLARDPLIGKAITESGSARTYAIDGAESRGWPTLVVVYVWETERITITDAKYSEPKFQKAGRA